MTKEGQMNVQSHNDAFERAFQKSKQRAITGTAEEPKRSDPSLDDLPPVIATAFFDPGAFSAAPIPPQGGTTYQGSSDRQRAVYIALGIFFGMLGIHNFYAKRTLAGVIELGVTVTLGWLLLPLGIVLLCVLCELLCVTLDGEGRRMR